MNFTVGGGDWKYSAVEVRSDVASASKRLPASAPPEPKISYPPTPDEPPSVAQTAQAILKLLQSAQPSRSEPEPAAQPASDTSADEGDQKIA